MKSNGRGKRNTRKWEKVKDDFINTLAAAIIITYSIAANTFKFKGFECQKEVPWKSIKPMLDNKTIKDKIKIGKETKY